ncbi:inositol monophosphatase [Suttonella sp. R2A3]|uniref:inositol monophosphatase family protein n=1 Tax=Suttonella sp. R2A3 TaxID=2908648 RepID=UPI001F305CAF|nr:inositol monophosphatase family protein [Suttonella sp. R2A3]UJF25147.1 inositol monophosphatase [Suttonella sp. R2A3]
MHPMLTIAKRAAEEAGRVIQQGYRQLEQIQAQEKSPGDFVSIVDQQAERAIKAVLHDKYPTHTIIGEESGETQGKPNKGGDDYQWIIDPLDGTANFLHGIAQFAVSIALMKNGRLEVGLVYDPINDELFTAARGQGAQLNGRRIRTNAQRDPARSIIGTGFPFKNPELMDQQVRYVGALLQEFSDLRRLGSAALDLCYVACGRLDAFYEMALNPWDIAAGILIAQEAGVIVTDLKEGHEMLDHGDVVCANPYLHKVLAATIKANTITETT